jgi:ketosteroid isomerase-like protein
MKRTIRIAWMVVLAIGVSSAVCQTSKAQGDKAGLEKTVNALLEAVKAKDAAKLKTYYTDDYTFTDPDGKMMSAEDRLKVMAAPDFNAPDSFSDIKVRTYGSTGVVTGMGSGKNSSGASEQTRFTQAWAWKDGRWWLAASHVSRVKM